MKIYPPPKSPYSPSAYDPPFTPRYSVPESFRRALSYEGQQHWLAGMCNELALFADTCHQVWIVDTATSYTTTEEATAQLGCDVVFDDITWPSMEPKSPIAPMSAETVSVERPDDLPLVKEGDVVAVRFGCKQDKTSDTCFFIGVLKEACRCVYPEKWKVHILCVVHDLSLRMKSAEARLTVLETDVEALYSRVTKLESRMTNAEGRITTLETKVATLETNLANLTTRVTNVEGRVTTLETNLSNLTTRVTKVEGDVTNLTSRVTKVEGDVTNLQNQVNEIKGDIPDVSGFVTSTTYNAFVNKTNNTLSGILSKIFGGGTVGSDGSITWPTADKIAIGNMNVYGGDSNAIKTRDGSVTSGSDNDVRVI